MFGHDQFWTTFSFIISFFFFIMKLALKAPVMCWRTKCPDFVLMDWIIWKWKSELSGCFYIEWFNISKNLFVFFSFVTILHWQKKCYQFHLNKQTCLWVCQWRIMGLGALEQNFSCGPCWLTFFFGYKMTFFCPYFPNLGDPKMAGPWSGLVYDNPPLVYIFEAVVTFMANIWCENHVKNFLCFCGFSYIFLPFVTLPL